MVFWSAPVATDNSKITPTATCNAKNGSHFGIGMTEVNCTAVDQAGNQATCSFTIDIVGKCLKVILLSLSFRENHNHMLFYENGPRYCIILHIPKLLQSFALQSKQLQLILTSLLPLWFGLFHWLLI